MQLLMNKRRDVSMSSAIGPRYWVDCRSRRSRAVAASIGFGGLFRLTCPGNQ
jgi:hypothetical protein